MISKTNIFALLNTALLAKSTKQQVAKGLGKKKGRSAAFRSNQRQLDECFSRGELLSNDGGCSKAVAVCITELTTAIDEVLQAIGVYKL